jgi:hypothetical protein
VPRAVKKFESLRDVGHIHPQTQLAGALPKRPAGRVMCAQSRAGESVHRFAEPNMALAPELFGGRGHIVIEPDRRAHAIIVASVMFYDRHRDAGRTRRCRSGTRLSQTATSSSGTSTPGYYSYNDHSDVGAVTGASGTTTAAYGYTACGSNVTGMFTGAAKNSASPGPTAQPYNSYRFNAMRWDSSSGLTSSPCTLRCPHAGLSIAMRITSLPIAPGVGGRPGRRRLL